MPAAKPWWQGPIAIVAVVVLIAGAALAGYTLINGGDDGAPTEPVATVEDVYDRVALQLHADYLDESMASRGS